MRMMVSYSFGTFFHLGGIMSTHSEAHHAPAVFHKTTFNVVGGGSYGTAEGDAIRTDWGILPVELDAFLLGASFAYYMVQTKGWACSAVLFVRIEEVMPRTPVRVRALLSEVLTRSGELLDGIVPIQGTVQMRNLLSYAALDAPDFLVLEEGHADPLADPPPEQHAVAPC